MSWSKMDDEVSRVLEAPPEGLSSPPVELSPTLSSSVAIEQGIRTLSLLTEKIKIFVF